MRLMGARSIWDMKMAAVVGVALSLPLMSVGALLGVMGKLTPEGQALTAKTADLLYPRLANAYLGIGLKGLVVAGILAAAISTFDSMGSALSAIFTRDVYARLIVRDRSDEHYVRVGRWATVATLLLGFAYLPFILLQKNMLDAFTSLIPVFVTPLFTLYVIGALTRAHKRSGLIGLICGSIYGMIALYFRESHKLGWTSTDWTSLWWVDRWGALCCSFLITSVAMGLTTWKLGPSETEGLVPKESGWLQRSREALPPLREHPFKSDPRWWASPDLWVFLLFALCAYTVFGLFW